MPRLFEIEYLPIKYQTSDCMLLKLENVEHIINSAEEIYKNQASE